MILSVRGQFLSLCIMSLCFCFSLNVNFYIKKNLSHLELFTTLYLVIVSSQVCVTA